MENFSDYHRSENTIQGTSSASTSTTISHHEVHVLVPGYHRPSLKCGYGSGPRVRSSVYRQRRCLRINMWPQGPALPMPACSQSSNSERCNALRPDRLPNQCPRFVFHFPFCAQEPKLTFSQTPQTQQTQPAPPSSPLRRLQFPPRQLQNLAARSRLHFPRQQVLHQQVPRQQAQLAASGLPIRVHRRLAPCFRARRPHATELLQARPLLYRSLLVLV